MSPVSPTDLLNVALSQLPNIISMIRGNQRPGVPPLTDDEVLTALNTAVAITMAKDDKLLAEIRKRRDAGEERKT